MQIIMDTGLNLYYLLFNQICRDEEDGVILNAEKEAEKKSAKKAIESWDDKETERRIFQKVGDIEIPDSNNDISQLAIPSKQQMETILLDKRKQVIHFIDET